MQNYINLENLSDQYLKINNINNVDIPKIYIREYSDKQGTYIKIANTNHPIWMCIKHFFISIFSFFNYRYESGHNALEKIKKNPKLLIALEKELFLIYEAYC